LWSKEEEEESRLLANHMAEGGTSLIEQLLVDS
jgi:hypothetical protein